MDTANVRLSAGTTGTGIPTADGWALVLLQVTEQVLAQVLAQVLRQVSAMVGLMQNPWWLMAIFIPLVLPILWLYPGKRIVT